MKKNAITYLMVVILGVVVAVACGCSGSSGSGSGSSGSGGSTATQDKAEIEEFIEADTTGLFKGFVDDSGTYQDSTKASKAAAEGQDDLLSAYDFEMRPWWYRSPAAPVTKTYTVQVTGDTALVTVNRQRDWVFNLDLNHDLTFGTKTAEHEAVRYAIFTRGASVDASTNSAWQLSSITVAEATMRDDTLDTLAIEELNATVDGETVFTHSSAAAYIDREDIPVLTAGAEVVVTAKATNSEGEVVVYLHNRAFRRVRHTRRIMFDDGVRGGDQTEGDDVYTGTYTVPSTPGYYHVAIDVISRTAFDDESTDNYSAYAWIFPYKVE